jgi:4-amino-4-deoxy-L-arabinose transferase-like glycosyltransferase
MNGTRRDWILLNLTLVGAATGQWIWLTREFSFLAGLTCYLVAVFSWRRMTPATESRHRPYRKVLLAWVGGVIFGILALSVLLRDPQQTPIALFLLVIALAYFAWAVSKGQGFISMRQPAHWGRKRVTSRGWLRHAIHTTLCQWETWIKRFPIRAVLVGGSILIVIGSGLAAHRGVRSGAYLVSLSAWGLGLFLYVLAFTPTGFAQGLTRWSRRQPLAPVKAQEHATGDRRGLWTGRRQEIAVMTALWGLAMLLRFANLGEIPYLLSGDEGSMGMEARHLLTEGQLNPFGTGWDSHPALYFYVLAFFLRLFGSTVFALRLGSALAGAITVPLTYLLARRMFGTTVALASGLFLAGYHLHVHYSHLALNNVWAPLAAVLTWLLLWSGLQTRQTWRFALGGITMGLGQYTYWGARLIPILVTVWLLYLAWVEKERLRGSISRLAVFWLAFGLTLLPLAWFFTEHYQFLVTRMNRVGIFGSEGADVRQIGALRPLAVGLFDSLLSLNYVHDRSVFYMPRLPQLHWLSGIAFVLGLTFVLRHRHAGRYGLLLIWLGGTLVFGAWLMNFPPHSQRTLLHAPAVAILVAVGLTQLSRWIGLLAGWSERVTQRWALLLTLSATIVSTAFYFGIYTPAHMFADPNTEVADRLGRFARELPPGHKVYFFGAPRMTYTGFRSIAFLAPHADIHDVVEPIENPLPIKNETTFVFVPQRLHELEIIAAAHPQGRRWEALDHQGRLLFVAYEVQRET